MTDYWFEDRLKELFRLYTGGALSPRWKNDKPNVSNRPRSNDLSQSEEGMKIKMAIKGKEKDPQILFSPTLPTEGELVRKGKHSYVVMEVYRPNALEPLHVIHVRPSEVPCKGGLAYTKWCVCGEREYLLATDRGNLCGPCLALMITRLSRENEDLYEELEETRADRDKAIKLHQALTAQSGEDYEKDLKVVEDYEKSLRMVNQADHIASITLKSPVPAVEDGIMDDVMEMAMDGEKKEDWRSRFMRQVDEAANTVFDIHDMIHGDGQPAFYLATHKALDNIVSAMTDLLEGLGLPREAPEEGQECPLCRCGTTEWNGDQLVCKGECGSVIYNRSPFGDKKEPKEVAPGWFVPHAGGCHGRPVDDGKCENHQCGYRGGKEP